MNIQNISNQMNFKGFVEVTQKDKNKTTMTVKNVDDNFIKDTFKKYNYDVGSVSRTPGKYVGEMSKNDIKMANKILKKVKIRPSKIGEIHYISNLDGDMFQMAGTKGALVFFAKDSCQGYKTLEKSTNWFSEENINKEREMS